MKIKSLHLIGFKSFSDRTELRFDQQIAGIVGPNGCGKSNIVDAIRWVMGEQSAKGLRGTEMSDVIFNGTATRKRASFAEVSLVFDNADHLAAAPYTDVEEIMITRRLYRSGESEYLINKVPVRLKDITDLFLGTGSSARAYSIVAQGKIDQVVLAKPEDRRFLLEEAAGVAKYKARKQAAERKMEASRANLERVHDIIRELERSSKSLERQVERAEQFRKIQTELRKLDEQIVGFKVTQLDSQAAANEKNRIESQRRFEEVSTQLFQLETEIEKWRLEALEQEKISTSDYEKLIELKERFAETSKELDLSAQRIQLLNHQIGEREKDIERIHSKSVANAEAIQQVLADCERLKEERVVKKTALDAMKAEVANSDVRLKEVQDRLGETEAALNEQRTIIAKQAQKREMLQAERVSLEVDRAAIEEKETSIEEQKTRAGAERIRIASEREAIEKNLEEAEVTRSRLEQELVQSRELESELSKDRRRIHEQLGEREGQIKSLEKLEEHEVGYDAGALERKKKTGEAFIMDLVRFKKDFEKAGEAFLSEFGQCFVWSDAGTFSEDDTRWSALTARTSGNAVAAIGSTLLDAVEGEVPDSLRPILASIDLVEVLDSSSSRAQIQSNGDFLIPLSSEAAFRSQGIVRKAETPFGRKEELARVRAEKEELKQDLQTLESRFSENKTRMEENSREQNETRRRAQDLIRTQAQINSQAARIDGQMESLERQLTNLKVELEETDARIVELETEISELVEESVSEELENRKAALVADVQKLKEERAELDRRWIEQRIEFGALEERLQRLEQQSLHVEMTQSEYQHNQTLFQTDIQTWTEEIQMEEAHIGELQKHKDDFAATITELEKKLAENKVTLNKLRSDLEQYEASRKEVHKDKEQTTERVQELELEHQRLKYEVDELSNLVQERYHISLQDILGQITEADIERLSDEVVLRSLEVDAKELRAKMDKFGEVNLMALTEYEEITKRLGFMNTQREDLLKTLDALQNIIDRINKITEFRFRETFKAINHNFQILFPKLFGGGRAYMTLTNENNLLETGVEIFAEPPGKKVQTMSLLSGGEKAMTSISLLFALFAYRPASFCILDEVDAPLDEVNTSRYNSIIQEMASLSQFIVITHNKRTMEVAETLFGVTMQEPGCSQLVGVNLQEARAFVGTPQETAETVESAPASA